MKTYAIVLAAGLGTRMKTDLPKCTYPLLCKPMIEYIVDSLEESCVDEIICVVGYKSSEIKNILKDRVKYVYQESQIGTANAVLQALCLLDDGISIVIPGDIPLIDSKIIDDLVINHSSNDITITTLNLDNPTGYGRIIRNNSIVKIVEDKDATEDELLIKEVNSGVFCLNNDILKKYIPLIKNNNIKNEYYFTDIVELANNHIIDSFSIKDEYKLTGINDLYALSKLEEYLIEEINKKHMLNGVNIINSKSVCISKDTVIDQGVTIYPNCVILGNTVIKKNCVIGPNSQLTNVILEDGVYCNSSVISDSKINSNCTIGPFSHIRMNCEINEDCRIGNFVEIKNSNLNKKNKASHLTYIGDCESGNNVNFGCGSITVNYDGKNKFKTIIEDNVFIGCNSNLVAPITIKSNSFIAAGTTVTKNVEQGDLVIGRVKQENKKGYFVG